MKRRLLRYALITLGVVLFTGYFAFRTFFFDPFEAGYGARLATLVPRDVDFFSAKTDLAGDFTRFPDPRLAEALEAHPAGRAFLESPEWREWSQSTGLADLQAQAREELSALPPGLDPLALFGGREVAFAGYLRPGGAAATDWIALGRTNWTGKLALELLSRPSWIGLEERGIVAEPVLSGMRLSGPQLARPLFVGRQRDVLLVATQESLLTAAEELEDRKGQDSFGQSARYHDHVEARGKALAALDAAEQPIEFYTDAAKLAATLGVSTAWPDPKSPEPTVAFLSRLFQLWQVLDLSAVASVGRVLRVDLHATVATEQHSVFQRRLHRTRSFDRGPVLNDVARLAPADTGLFVYAQTDAAALLREWLAVQEPALRENLVSHIVRPLFGGTSVEDFVTEFDAAFRDQMALIVRANDYPDMGPEGPPHNDVTVPAWTLALWVESRDRIDELRQKVIQNQARFGIQGRESGSGGVFTNEVQGGFVVYEYWSPAVQGTGHIASVNDGQLFLLSNSYQMIGQVLTTYYQGGDRAPRLADSATFQNLMQEGQASSTLLAYVQPGPMAETLRKMAARAAEDDLFARVDWQAKRAEFGKQVVAERFPGQVWGRLSAEVSAQVERLVDERIAAFQREERERSLPMRLDALDRRVAWLDALQGGLFQWRFAERSIDVAVRALFRAAPQS